MASLLICWSTLFLAGLVLGMQSCEHKSCLILLVGQVSNDQGRRLLLDVLVLALNSGRCQLVNGLNGYYICCQGGHKT